MKNKKMLLVALSAITCLSLAGCKKEDTSSVKLLNFKPELADKWEKIKTEFEKDTGIRLVVETAAEGNYESTLRAQIDTDNSPTIFQISGLAGYNSWKAYCSDMTNLSITSKLTDKGLAVKSDSKIYGIPYSVEGFGIIYNKALTDKYFKATNFTRNQNVTAKSMEEVKSYAMLKNVVEDMQKHKLDLGIDGVFAASGLDGSTSWRITGHTFNMPLVAEFGNPTTVPSTFNFTGSAHYKNLLDLYVTHSTMSTTNMVSSKWDNEKALFSQGKVVMVQNGQWATNDLSSTTVPANNLKFLPLYTGANQNINGGDESKQGLCVGTEAFWTINSKHSDAKKKNAETFLNWLLDGNGRKYAITDLGFSAPYSGFADANLPKQTDALVNELGAWVSKEGIKSVPWAFNYTPDTEPLRQKIVAGLKDYYNDGLSDAKWNELVESTKSEWTKLYQQKFGA